jgi:hypothetical protein
VEFALDHPRDFAAEMDHDRVLRACDALDRIRENDRISFIFAMTRPRAATTAGSPVAAIADAMTQRR